MQHVVKLFLLQLLLADGMRRRWREGVLRDDADPPAEVSDSSAAESSAASTELSSTLRSLIERGEPQLTLPSGPRSPALEAALRAIAPKSKARPGNIGSLRVAAWRALVNTAEQEWAALVEANLVELALHWRQRIDAAQMQWAQEVQARDQEYWRKNWQQKREHAQRFNFWQQNGIDPGAAEQYPRNRPGIVKPRDGAVQANLGALNKASARELVSVSSDESVVCLGATWSDPPPSETAASSSAAASASSAACSGDAPPVPAAPSLPPLAVMLEVVHALNSLNGYSQDPVPTELLFQALPAAHLSADVWGALNWLSLRGGLEISDGGSMLIPLWRVKDDA